MTFTEDTNVGSRIRQLREQQSLSLRKVAERSGLSINAISRIERGDNSPTVASLHLLANALKVSITEFFLDPSNQSVIHTIPSQRLRTTTKGMRTESLGIGLSNQQLEPFQVWIEPDYVNRPEPITHDGQEFVYCIHGEIDYEVGGTIYHLQSGHSLLFEASQPHCFWNSGKSTAQLLFIFQAYAGNHLARRKHLHT